MAACSDTEEKPSSPKETLPLKIRVENAVNHEMRKNCYNELSNISKNNETFPETAEKSNPKDVSSLSEDEFRELMIEASTFNKSSNQESDLLKKLRQDNPVTDTEPSDKVKLIRNCTSQFSLHRNSKNYIATSSLACSSSQLRTSDGRKKHSRNKDDSSSRNVLNANVLQKSIHQSQSLQDLSSEYSKSKQKSHKAHRTHSLSSDEVLGIDSDSLVPLKGSKKSGKASSSNSAKLEASNKTSFSKGSSKSHNLGLVSITLDMDDENEPCISEDSLPHQSAISVNCRKEQGSEKGTSTNSPIEIEMEEIKSDKASCKDDRSLASTNLEKSENRLAKSNSTFYVDKNDVDTTVTFPLKIVPSNEDQNCDETVSELKQFPISPWPRPIKVQSFFSTLTMDSDTNYNSRNEKQLLNADINGNPFARNARSAHLASFVSNTMVEYGNVAGSVPESKNRKNKRLRNSVNKGVLSEEIAGHRGEEDIDTLLKYINSSDKKGKSAVKGNSQNQVLSSKNSFLQENEKKKPFSKELKSCNKNLIHTDQKKLTRSNSLENMTSAKLTNVTDVFTFKPRASVIDSSLKDSNIVDFENSVHKNLDINSNEENKFELNEKGKDSSTDESSLHNSMGRSSPEVSSFAADFYSTADVSSQTTEESGFSLVKKKQRKKHPSKRSDSHRWRNAQAQRKKGIMLPLAESKCGKQDSRRKSTSSVPHSEHSSADNSDLDSVHSLPVRGSVPHPTQPHPHTTPSSSSSTPQASYADIARMPISKLNSPSPCIITYSAQTSVSQVIGEEETKKTDNSASTELTMGKRRVSDSTPINKEMPQATTVDNDSDSFTTDVKVRSHAKSTREINTQTEPESTAVVDPSKVEHSSGRSMKKVDDSSKTMCNVCSSSRKNTCSCPKSHVCVRQKVKCVDIPPVIMDNMPSESNACNVSFGFGIEEVFEMPPANNPSLSSDLRQKDNLENSNTCEEVDLKDEEKKGKCDGIFEISSVNNKTATMDADSSCKSSSSLDVISKTVHNQDLSLEQSSHLKTVCYGTGRNICYSETKVNMKKFNLSEIANFLGTEFQSIEKEIEGNSRNNKASSKGMYYIDSSEEA